MADNVTDINAGKDKDTARLPTRDELFKLKREIAAEKAKMDEARGVIGAAYKNASNDKNAHKKAFKDILKISNMDDETRDAYLSHFDHYREQMGIDEGRTGNLFDGEKVAAE